MRSPKFLSWKRIVISDLGGDVDTLLKSILDIFSPEGNEDTKKIEWVCKPDIN